MLKAQTCAFWQTSHQIQRLNGRTSSAFAEIIESSDEAYLAAIGSGKDEQVKPVGVGTALNRQIGIFKVGHDADDWGAFIGCSKAILKCGG